MNYFSKLFGFQEAADYAATRDKLRHMAEFETVSNRHYLREKCTFQLIQEERGGTASVVSAGIFSFPSVQELRAHVEEVCSAAAPNDNSKKQGPGTTGKIRIQNVVGEARSLHRTVAPGAVVQAASQFNLLEFASPSVTPEDGITGYVYDGTQGPACAIACAAGTAYRNYLVPVPFREGEERGQTPENQLNGLQDIQEHIIRETDLTKVPWKVRNGYVASSSQLINPFNQLLQDNTLSEEALISLLRIGVQEHAAVTDDPGLRQTVTQTYNSAVSIGYSRLRGALWEPLARLVLRATYEATLLVGVLATVEAAAAGNPQPPPILLTKVGGGVFANKDAWIVDAMKRAIHRVAAYGVDLDVKIVHFGQVDEEYRGLEDSTTSSTVQSEL